MVDNASSQPWTSDRSLAFISLSQRLSNLEKLDFGQADWRVAPECVWASVLAAIERGRVSELRLKNCYFPDFPKFFHFLQAAKRLKKLTLDQSGVGVWDDNNSLDVDQIAMSCDMSGAPSTTTIEFLHFDCDFDTPITCLLHPRIKQAVDITRLQTLIYRKSRHYTFLATQLLPAVALNGTLRSLELQLTLATNRKTYSNSLVYSRSISTTVQSPIPLASLSTLQILKIRSQHSRHSDGGAWFASSFAGIHPAHALEEIFLQVEGIARDSDEEIDWTSWSALDDILRPPQFDNLHAVHVRILFQYQNSHIETLHARMQENFDKFVSLLPILQGAGFLKAELDLGRYSWCLDRDAVFNAASSI